MAVTTGRKSQLTVGKDKTRQLRGAYQMSRKAYEMGLTLPNGAPASSEVWLLPPGDAWALQLLKGDPAQVLRTDYSDVPLTAADVNAATGITAFSGYKKPTDTGLGVSADVVATGGNFWQKRVAAGASWVAELTADVTAFAKATLPVFTLGIDLDRILSGKKSYAANQPFGLGFASPGGIAGNEGPAFLRLYFGGPCPVVPSTTRGGEFAITLLSNGQAVLQERAADFSWVMRSTFAWSDVPHPSSNTHSLKIVPYGLNRIAVFSKHFQFSIVGERLQFGASVPIPWMTSGSSGIGSFQELRAETGQRHTSSMTGAGIVRVDVQRNYREPFSISALKYPSSGTLVDHPILFRKPLPLNTTILAEIDRYVPVGTTLAVQLYDLDTNLALTPTAFSGEFLSTANMRGCYAIFTLSASDRSQTPVIYGYHVNVPALYGTRTVTPVTGGLIQSATLNGPDLMPDQDLGTVLLEDPDDTYGSVLRTRDGESVLYSVVDSGTGAVISHLFEGVVSEVPAELRGKPVDASSYPGADWWEYNLALQPLWQRLARRKIDHPDALIPILKTSTAADFHPKITDVIKKVFDLAGVPAEELDVPDQSLLLYLPEDNPLPNYYLIFGGDPTKILEFLIKDILGQALVRDPNAGISGGATLGMWRVLTNPQYLLSNALATFHVADPAAGKDPVDDSAYATGHTWVKSYREWRQRPENSSVLITGKNTATGHRFEAYLENPNAYTEGNLDWVGEDLPYVPPPNPALPTQEATNHLARITYARACKGRVWFSIEAPLLLITDPLDTVLQRYRRPLRVNDVVNIIKKDGTTAQAYIRSVRIRIVRELGGDDAQMATYQGIFV